MPTIQLTTIATQEDDQLTTTLTAPLLTYQVGPSGVTLTYQEAETGAHVRMQLDESSGQPILTLERQAGYLNRMTFQRDVNTNGVYELPQGTVQFAIETHQFEQTPLMGQAYQWEWAYHLKQQGVLVGTYHVTARISPESE